MSADPILILGASSDLGLALMRHLLAEQNGPIVAHGYGSIARVEDLAARHPGLVSPVCADLEDPASVAGLIQTVRERHGVPRAIAHFAARPLRLERFSKWDAEHFRRDLAIQLESLVQVLRSFLPEMAKREGVSKVVMMLSSVDVGAPPKYMSMYTVVKYAQLGLLRALAAEYAGTNVRINGISPAMVETRFLSEVPAKAVEQNASQMPGGRNLLPAEVVVPAAFLLGPGSDSLNGVNIVVANGGVF